MKKVTTKRIKRLKNKSIWPSIIYMLFSLISGAILIGVLVAAIVSSVLENRYFESNRQADVLKEDIANHLSKGDSPESVIKQIEDSANAPLAISIFDKENRLIASYGDKLDEDLSKIDVEDLDIHILLDRNGQSEYSADNVNKNSTDSVKQINEVSLNLVEIAERFAKGISLVNDKKDYATVYTYEVYDVNYWIKSIIESEDMTLCVKYKQAIYINDCLFAFIILIFSVVIFVILVISHFINAISSVFYQKTLLKMLLEDNTTGGHNMLAFEQFAERELIRKKKNAYAVVDFSLLRYQNYCTLYGISEGEKMITLLERIISNYLRRGEYVAKVSNSDFVLLMTEKGDSDYRTIFNQRVSCLFDEITNKLKMTSNGVQIIKGLQNIVLKAGIYVVDPAIESEDRIKRKEQSKNIDQLYMKAGIAKQALTEDFGIVMYDHDMWERELWEQKVEDNMQRALDNCEFQVYIQPKYNPSTEELMGGEALVRWISPTDGFISPGKFIPIFEKNGFITRLDDYMISNTAKLQAKWMAEGKKIVPISVNVSRLHFSQPDLAEHLRDLVDQYNLPRKYIEIELTESAFFDDKKALLRTVKRLQEYGFEVSMDDFGAGYSSLNSLKDLPLNVLKLDADFFRGDEFDTRGEVVVSEAISLAKQLNMRIVAEGVEKKNQVDFLAKHNCDMIQGFYFAKPMPAEEYESRMK